MIHLLELLVYLVVGPHVHFPDSEPGSKGIVWPAHRQPFSIAQVGRILIRPRRLIRGRSGFT